MQVSKDTPDELAAISGRCIVDEAKIDALESVVSRRYRAVLGYNCSNLYALSVTLLADAISLAGSVAPAPVVASGSPQ